MCVLATRLPFIITIEHFNVVEGGVFKFSKNVLVGAMCPSVCRMLCGGQDSTVSISTVENENLI